VYRGQHAVVKNTYDLETALDLAKTIA